MKKVIRAYWQVSHRMLIGALTSVLIWMVMYALDTVSLEVLKYAVLLTLYVWTVLIAIDFGLFLHQYKRLSKLKTGIVHRSEPVVNPKAPLYTEMLNLLIEEKKQTLTEKDAMKTNMMDYYSVWVHQIKTPIAALDLLVQSTEHENKEAMNQALFKIEQYVYAALNYLRLESETTDFVIKPTAIYPLVKKAVKKHRVLFEAQKIALTLEPFEDTVITDEKWLTFVIEQLLANALKYSPSGEIAIAFKKGALAIKDTGCGISAEDLPRVFERGFTGFNGRRLQKSTGIGLYLSKRIVNQLGHGIQIESEVGKGTTVRIVFHPYTDVR